MTEYLPVPSLIEIRQRLNIVEKRLESVQREYFRFKHTPSAAPGITQRQKLEECGHELAAQVLLASAEHEALKLAVTIHEEHVFQHSGGVDG